ncbi:MAG: hypothetical protein U9R42_03690 [Bacteroidota bacterium]|nr:hypothetical protein [Bacteroidota bacterium]
MFLDERIEATNAKPSTTIPNCKPTGIIFWVDFDNISFYFANDTLHHIQKNDNACKGLNLGFVVAPDSR